MKTVKLMRAFRQHRTPSAEHEAMASRNHHRPTGQFGRLLNPSEVRPGRHLDLVLLHLGSADTARDRDSNCGKQLGFGQRVTRSSPQEDACTENSRSEQSQRHRFRYHHPVRYQCNRGPAGATLNAAEASPTGREERLGVECCLFQRRYPSHGSENRRRGPMGPPGVFEMWGC